MKLILEQRYLFDGSAATLGHHAASGDAFHQDAHSGASNNHDESLPAGLPPAAERQAPAADPAPGPAGTAASGITTVLIVDPRVTNWQSLVAGAKPNVDVVVLDPTKDGVAQVTRALAGLSEVRNLEFLTDGTPGSVTLGGSTLDLAALTSRAPDIEGWGAHLAANADIVFWGCDVGQGSAGAAFVADVHTLTGATVGASAEAVGSAALGGGWDIDVTTGRLHSDATPFTAGAMANYTGILDTPDPTVTLATSGTLPHEASGTVLLGDTVNFSLSFTNAAANATGYGPFIELFAPSSLALSSINSAGVALTPLHATVSGAGTFTNPLTGVSETAPAGAANETAYIITLPYGSFTPGEPAVGVSGSFSMSDSSALVGTTLPIEARAGFEFGAVATGGTPIAGTAVSAPEQVLLIESWLTVATRPGEGETATGPDFPVTYTLNLEPAPAVAATNTPVTNLTISVPLPNGIIETGSASATGGGTASVSSAAVAGGTEQTLSINYPSLSGAQSVTFQAYVPEFYQYTANGETGGSPILDPSTGLPVAISVSPAYTLASDPWNGIAITGDTGDVSAAAFQAKSLAVQLVANTGSALPTQDITYTLKFEVSDYFGVSGLGLNSTLGDGLSFDPTVTPVLTVNAGTHGGIASATGSFAITSETTATVNADYPETVASSGSGANISYAFDGATGSTLVSFNANALLPGIYGAGTTGSVTFAATVLPAYPTATDNVAGAGGFLRESDSVSATSTADTATALYDYTGSAYAAAGNPIEDGTATPVDTLPDGSLTLSVVDVDGVAYTGQTIAPGDTVTYQLVYTLAQPGDFAALNLAAYIPEPVFSVLNPSNPDATTASDFSGSGTSAFALNAAATAATLASGDYTYAVSAGLTGVTVTGATGSEPANSVTFSVASPLGRDYFKDSTGAGAQQAVTIDFAVTASSLPFVNGLHLTAQGDSSYTPAQAGKLAYQQIQMLYLGDPLLGVEQGVVSVVNDAGTDISAQTGIGWTLPPAAPGGSATSTTDTAAPLFAKAGSAGVFVNGATVPAVLTRADDNLSLSGAQAGDTVRIVDAVQNAGNFPAYDVIVKDALAQGLTTANVSNLTFTRGDGTVLEALDPATGSQVTGAAAVADYFSGGVLLTVAGSTAAPVLASASAANPSADIVYATFDIKLPDSAPTAASLTGQATIVAWTNQDEYSAATGFTLTDPVAGTDGNFAHDSALGAVLTSSATVATAAPAITDTITGAADASDTGLTGGNGIPANSFAANAATAVPGETLRLSATVTLPQGVNGLVAPVDILPAGLTLIGTAGTYHATYQDNQGDAPVDLTSSLSVNTATNTLTLAPQNLTVLPHAGGDQPGTITVTYQALVPQTQATAIDTTSWGNNAATGNLTRTDSFAANSEGLSYTTTTATQAATTTGTGYAGGIANVVTVINPLVTAAITELNGTNGQNVHSGEALTYQLTLTNDSSAATAYDLTSSLSLPAGITYVAGSLAQTGGASAQQIASGNVASNGAASPGAALSGVTLAPGATVVFTFQGTVNNNLPDGTVLTVSAKPAWESLPASAAVDGAGNVNPQAQAYAGAPGSVSNSIANVTPVLSIIGESNRTTNETAGTFDPVAQATGTDGSIVRMRAVLEVPEGQNTVSLNIALPNGLTYQNDGSTDVLLVSPGGDFASSTLAGGGPQLASGTTAVDLTKLGLGLPPVGDSDPVTTQLAASAITVNGQAVTFNVGTLTNNDSSPLPNYVVVEFNAVVGNTRAATATPLSTTLTGAVNTVNTGAVSDATNVVAPTVSLAKAITNIAYSGSTATVTYTDTETNTGTSAAYAVSLADPGAGTGTVSYTGTSGPETPASAGPNGTSFDAVLPVLKAGETQTLTYTVTIASSQVAAAVASSGANATLTSYALNPAHEVNGQETLAGTSLSPYQSAASAAAGLVEVAGTVNQDISATGQPADTTVQGLPQQSVSVTFAGQTGTETVPTANDGSFSALAPGADGAVTVVATTSTPHAPATDALNNRPDLAAALTGTSASVSGTDPATLTFTPVAGASYTGIPFDFYTAPDKAPVLTAGGTTTFQATEGTPIVPFAGATVTDVQLDALAPKDYSGTTMVVQRYVNGSAAPDATDVFAGSGTLTLSGGAVMLGSTTVGSYTEANGVLTVRFASTGVTNATVNSVLGQVAYDATAANGGTVIGARIDDANNDPIVLAGGTHDPNGPHDQGIGGDLQSNVLTATVNVSAIAPVLSVVGESNVTAGTARAFDPTGQTAGTAVLTTDSGIVRMRALVELPEGANAGTSIVVTLPGALTYQNDGSTDVLLVSPGGNATAPSLTGTGLQLAEGTTPADLTKLGLGVGGTDPVVAALTGANAIGVSGQQVTFNLGNVTFANTAAGPNYAIVEFNAVVADGTPATTALSTAMVGTANSVTTSVVHDYVSVEAPVVSLTKAVKGIVYDPATGNATVTYTDTETNAGNGPAYKLSLTDPGAGPGTTVTYTGTTGPETPTSAGPNGSHFDAVLPVLQAGETQVFTYTVTIPASQVATAVSDSTARATLTSYALNPAHETAGQETLAGTSLAPPQRTATATAGLDLISGTVNQDTAFAQGADLPSLLTPLQGQTVSVTYPGQTGTESVTTNASGNYALLVPDSGVAVALTVATATAGPYRAPSPDSLDNPAALAGSVPGGVVSGTTVPAATGYGPNSGTAAGFDPATVTFTAAPNTSYSPVVFDFWRPLDTNPVLAGGPSAPYVPQTNTLVTLFPNATVSDAEIDGNFSGDYSGTTLTLQRWNGPAKTPDATDVFSASGTSTTGLFFSGSTVEWNGAVVGSLFNAGGVLSITFNPTGITKAIVNDVLEHIVYTSTLPGNPLVPGIVIGAQIDDANNDPIALNGNSTDPAGPHDQGAGGDLYANVLTATVDIHGPAVASTFTEPNDTNPANAPYPVTVEPNIDLTNVANTPGTPSQVVLTIANPHPEDVLAFTNTADITGTYSNGTLTLLPVNGRAPTLAEWQAAIRSVQYYDTSETPYTATRDITVTLTSGASTATDRATVAIVPTDDSPILNTAVTPTLNDSTEYQGTGSPAPSGPVGTLVSQLAGLNSNVTDGDGPGLTNGAPPAAPGIAITGFSTTDVGGRSVGTWYYSTDNGTTWTAFPATISNANPLDLASTARIAFQPTATDFNGQVPNAVTFRAWDGFDGTANGTQATDLNGVTAFGQSAANNTPQTAYSIATDTLPLLIDNVNNAPFASGAVTLPPVSTSEQHPPGETVTQLFSGGFSDPLDGQLVPVANPLGSTSNGMAGIAITGNAATHSQGVWEYSLDGGNTWTAIPATVSLTSAVILPAAAKIAFQPEDGFSGHPGLLTVNLIDSSATRIAPGLTGAQLAAEGTGGVPLAAATNVDIQVTGGSTAFSAGTMTLGTLVNPLPPPQRSAPSEPAGPVQSQYPDDNATAPTGVQFWTTDDYLHRPLIPDLSLVGSVANRFIIETQQAVISVPANIFTDSLPNAQLTYEAKLPDGTALPSWLTFNPSDLTFSGTPPLGSHGRVEILIRARDIAGNTADANFNILIGREQQDLIGLLRTGSHGRLALPPAPHADNLRHAPADRDALAGRIAARAAMLADLPPPASHGAGGFSSALHAAGPMSALGRARAWLDSLAAIDRHRPAA